VTKVRSPPQSQRLQLAGFCLSLPAKSDPKLPAGKQITSRRELSAHLNIQGQLNLVAHFENPRRGIGGLKNISHH